VTQGLAFDLELGNLVKATRFGYLIQTHHGTRPLSFEAQREIHGGTFVHLGEPRWELMNTLFSLSEANLFAQLVDRLEADEFQENMSYRELHRILRSALDEAHNLGELKSQIAADPDRFVELDPELTLLDQKQAGKLLLLVTNSDWIYTRSMMTYALDRFLPGGMYVGGDALLVESSLGLSGAQILYVGDHLFARQVERYADIYTSRVSNFLAATPFAYPRAARGSLPHGPA